jgi:O-antigen ligase
MMERMQNLLWYAFVLLLPWQTVWIVRETFVGGEKWQYATLGLYVSDVALLACAAFLALYASRDVWRGMFRDAIVWIFVALLAWSLLSIVWAMEKNMALLSAWRVLLAMLTYACARYGGVSFWKTLFVFLISMTLQAGLAISQWVLQFVSASSLLGIAEHDPSRWGTFVLKTESGRFLRAYGGFEHPNILGGTLAIATLFGVWLSATAKGIVARIGFLGMTIMSSFALVFTFSRSAWMGFGIGVIVIGFFVLRFGFFQVVRRSQKRIFLTCSSRVGANFRKILFFDLLGVLLLKCSGVFYRKNFYLLMILFFIAISFSIGFLLVRDIAMSRFSEETLAREGALSDRRVYMQQALVLIREHPILGVGGGNFTAFTQAHFPESGNFVGDFQPVHTVPILVFVELGAVGFVLFASLFVFGFLCAWREKNMFAGMILCALLSMLFLDHWLWSGHFGVLFSGFLFGIIAFSFSISKTSKRESG